MFLRWVFFPSYTETTEYLAYEQAVHIWACWQATDDEVIAYLCKSSSGRNNGWVATDRKRPLRKLFIKSLLSYRELIEWT